VANGSTTTRWLLGHHFRPARRWTARGDLGARASWRALGARNALALQKRPATTSRRALDAQGGSSPLGAAPGGLHARRQAKQHTDTRGLRARARARLPSRGADGR